MDEILTGEQLIELASNLPLNTTIQVRAYQADIDRLAKKLYRVMPQGSLLVVLWDDPFIPHIWLIYATGKLYDNLDKQTRKMYSTKTTWDVMLSSRRKRTNES